jgi:voltage-gated potassium channel Kch
MILLGPLVDPPQGTHMVTAYMSSLYWATVTVSGTGYGDITPRTTVEQVRPPQPGSLKLLV